MSTYKIVLCGTKKTALDFLDKLASAHPLERLDEPFWVGTACHTHLSFSQETSRKEIERFAIENFSINLLCGVHRVCRACIKA